MEQVRTATEGDLDRLVELTTAFQLVTGDQRGGVLVHPSGDGGHPPQARAAVCLKCPMNVKDWPFVEDVAAIIRKPVEIKNKLELKLDGEKSLHTCSGCGCVLKLKLWLPVSRLGLDAAELAKFDLHCWMRAEFKP